MGIYGSFVSECSTTLAAYVNAYVVSISGTTVTMSCPATATNSTPVAIQFGQPRYSATSTVLAYDLGAQTLKVGPSSQGNTASWLNQISTGQDYRTVTSAQVLGQPGGGYALVVGSRTSDSSGGAQAFPLISQFYADTWSSQIGDENAYFQSVLSAATAGTTSHSDGAVHQ